LPSRLAFRDRRIAAYDRKRLEQLRHHITRPALSDERVQCVTAGQVELKLKTSWRDGTTHLVMTSLEFMQRLAALVTPGASLALGCWRDACASDCFAAAESRP
jgi:Putative transposase